MILIEKNRGFTIMLLSDDNYNDDGPEYFKEEYKN
jgi:hypothetical protein